MVKKKMGLLVMAYGTPYKEDDIERYYTHIRHGQKASEEALEDLRYDIRRLVEFLRLQKSQKSKLWFAESFK